MTWWRWLILMLVVAASLWVDRYHYHSFIISSGKTELLCGALAYSCYWGQLFLLAVLAVLLTGRPLLRWTVLGALATVAWYLVALESTLDEGAGVALRHWSVLAVNIVAVLLWRFLLKARLVWPGSATEQRFARQFTLAEMLIATTAAAGLLWLGRKLLIPTTVKPDDWEVSARWIAFLLPPLLALELVAMAMVWHVHSRWRLVWVLAGVVAFDGIIVYTTTEASGWAFLYLKQSEWWLLLIGVFVYVVGVLWLLRGLGFRYERSFDRRKDGT